jgi:hypothetical protein
MSVLLIPTFIGGHFLMSVTPPRPIDEIQGYIDEVRGKINQYGLHPTPAEEKELYELNDNLEKFCDEMAKAKGE